LKGERTLNSGAIKAQGLGAINRAAKEYATAEASYYIKTNDEIEASMLQLKEKKTTILKALRDAALENASAEEKAYLTAAKNETQVQIDAGNKVLRAREGRPMASLGFGSFKKGIGTLGQNAAMMMPMSGPTGMVAMGLSNLGTYGAVAGATLAAAGGIAAYSVDKGTKAEDAMATLAAQSGLGQQDLDELRHAAEGYAKKFGTTVPEAIDAIRLTINAVGLQVTKNIPELEKMTDDIMTLSKAGKITPEESADTMGNLFNSFGGRVQDGQKAMVQFDRLMNVLAAGARQARVQIPQLAEAIKDVGAVAHMKGLSPEDVTASLEVLGHVGLDPSQTGVGLRNFLIQMSHGGKAQQDALAKLGLTFQEVNPEIVGYVTSLQKINAALAKIPKTPEGVQEKADIMGALFQKRNATIAAALLDNIDLLEKWRTEITGTNTAQEMANKNMATFSEAMKRFSAHMESAAVEVYMKHKDFFDTFPDRLGEFVDRIVGDFEEIDNLIHPGKALKGSLIGGGKIIATDKNGNPIYATGANNQNAPMSFRAQESDIVKRAQEYSRSVTGPNAAQYQDAIRTAIDRIKADKVSALNSQNPTKFYQDIANELEYLQKLTKGFRAGGYTGDGSPSDIAGVVHRGEFVFDVDSTNRVGANALDNLRKGNFSSGGLIPAFNDSPLLSQTGAPKIGGKYLVAGAGDDMLVKGGTLPEVLALAVTKGIDAAKITENTKKTATATEKINVADFSKAAGNLTQSVYGLAQMSGPGKHPGGADLAQAAGGSIDALGGVANALGASGAASGLGAVGSATQGLSGLAGMNFGKGKNAYHGKATKVIGSMLGSLAPMVSMIPGFGTIAGAGMGLLGGLVGSFDKGTDYVPRTGLAMVHEGEQIKPKGSTNRIHPADIQALASAMSSMPSPVIHPATVRSTYAQGNNAYNTW
ncbi:MAG: phage tail tape measure protein, partial [Patescibacteria group bacterium]|nr:phage tail tape measure protein [Patescibacteria group bacterium]